VIISNRLGMTEAAETMLAQQNRLDQVANNIANVDTAGFRREKVTFWEMLYRANDNRQRVGKGMKPVTDQSSGPVKMTGNPLDVAIQGEGFFKIQTPGGVRYTRAGNFLLNEQGQLAMPGGNLVLGDGGAIVLGEGQVSIGRDGTIAQNGAVVGQLAVVSFADKAALEREGVNLFRLKEGGGGEEQSQGYEVQQSYVEQSNVQSILEMTAMIDLARDFESQQKAVRTLDDIDAMATQRVGKLTV